MKFIRFLGVLWLLVPSALFAAPSSEFQKASQLLSAARRGDTQTIQVLINNGANVNYVDSTGLSLVCTAVMNNDRRAIQVLQMYGADASQCDRQIKNYKQKSRVAARGEEYGFFSGLSSSHILALSAIGVAAVIGGVALLTDAFDAKNNNGASSSGGSHSGSGGGSSGGSSGTQWGAGATPYGPAYLTSSGEINKNTNIAENLTNWDTGSNSVLRVEDFNYLRKILTVGGVKTSQAELDGVNPLLENYLLDMHGYNSFANGYMGQFTFRDSVSRAPLLPQTGFQKQPVRVALITGNGINPAGSADLGDGIVYVSSTAADAETTRVDKYVNNTLNKTVIGTDVVYSRTEQTGFDLSGSGSAFNPFANVNDSALAKIVAGWEAGGRTSGDLYGFVPNGQLAIYRTGNGNKWSVIENSTSQASVGTFTDNDSDGKLSSGDVVVIGGKTYNIVTALSKATADSTVDIGGTSFKLSTESTMLIGVCDTSSGCSTNIGIYVGTDGAWYVNSDGGNNVNNVYIADSGNVYNYKTTADAAYSNFSAMQAAVANADVVANTNVLPQSRQYSYLTVDNFTKAATLAGASGDLKGYYALQITNDYGTYTYDLSGTTVNEAQGGIANSLFNNYSSSKAMMVMPAGDYLYKDAASGTIYYDTLSATYENYAPMIYGNNLEHNFMTVVGVSHTNGNSDAATISEYGDGTGSAYGKLQLSLWVDSNEDVYSSRKCGIAGQGGSGVDPWCFAASGPTAEMATASAAGAVASVKSAFPYMSTDQIFTLLALTADGPYLKTNLNGTAFSTDNLVAYLQSMYELPLEYNVSTMASDEYIDAFKEVFGYGLINLERAITPGYSVYYYSDGEIVSSSGNAFWGKTATISSSSSSSPRASTVLNARGTVRTAFYDILESADGSMYLPRVWNSEFSLGGDSNHGLYMGDVLADFAVDSTNKHTNKIGNMTFDMAMLPRAYVDNLNGLDGLNIKFSNEDYDLNAGYQHYLTNGESRFSGRANGVLSLVSNSVSSGAKYKTGNFAFGVNAFSGMMTDENLLENDPVVSSQFEPARLGFANGGSVDVSCNNDKFGLEVSFGNMNETNTVLGSISDGLLALNGAKTQYVDMVANYKPVDKFNLFARATFADTVANVGKGIISDLSNIKSNAFALGLDAYGFSFSAAMPLAVVDGKMGYDYAEFTVVENNGTYEVAMNNPHVEYIDLAPEKRELRFSGAYRQPLGEFTDAGIGFIYRVNPGNTDAFGNESIMMFKIHHRLGI